VVRRGRGPDQPDGRLKPPKVGEKIVPVFTEDELIRLSKTCKGGKTLVDRRDHAIIELFKATGMRLSEMAGIEFDPEHPDRNDLDLESREVRVHGKGRKERVVKFNYDAARAIDVTCAYAPATPTPTAPNSGSASTTANP
jgi:site-specific recombinase XerC